jgi:hypothetical protein
MSLLINKNFTVPQLHSPNNYHDWLIALTTFLEVHDLWDYICLIPLLAVRTSATPVILLKGKKDTHKFDSTPELKLFKGTSLDEAIAKAPEISMAKLQSKCTKAHGFILATLMPSVQASLLVIKEPHKILESLHEK